MGVRGRGAAYMASSARDLLKKGVRTAGVLTSDLRTDPDFLIIGAKRGGTTSLYFDLLEHPGILRLFPPPLPVVKGLATKGIHYFDTSYQMGDRWYRSYMPTRARRSIASRRQGVDAKVGEASPYYLFHPAAAQRAHDLVPNARIVLLLRDPVMRTYSHWKERRRAGAETLSFRQALEAEDSRIAGEQQRLIDDPHYTSYAWEQQSYATQSEYAPALRRWMERFGRERIFVAASEEYYADPNGVLGDIYEFLGLPRLATATGVRRNAASGDELTPDLVDGLRSRFAASNRELQEMVGRTFPWS